MSPANLPRNSGGLGCRAKRTSRSFGPYNNTYCHVFTVRDGKIVAAVEYLDTLLVERAPYGRKLAE